RDGRQPGATPVRALIVLGQCILVPYFHYCGNIGFFQVLSENTPCLSVAVLVALNIPAGVAYHCAWHPSISPIRKSWVWRTYARPLGRGTTLPRRHMTAFPTPETLRFLCGRRTTYIPAHHCAGHLAATRAQYRLECYAGRRTRTGLWRRQLWRHPSGVGYRLERHRHLHCHYCHQPVAG